MFGLDEFSVLIFADAANDVYKKYDWVIDCHPVGDWNIENTQRTAPESEEQRCIERGIR